MLQDISIILQEKIKNKKAVIWDFDGVIFFANWNYGEKFEQWWDKLWILLEKYEPDIRKKFKNGLKHYHEHTDYIISKYGADAYKEINNFYLEKEMMILPFSRFNYPLIKLIKNLPPSVEQFVWSNNQDHFINTALKEAGIFHKFKSVVSRNKFLLAKPNLDGFKIIKALTSTTTNNFIIIGDSASSDGVAAKELGIEFFKYVEPNITK